MDMAGKKQWAFAAGNIPLRSHGLEPEFTSHDKIAILNTGHKDAAVRLSIYYASDSPVGEHEIVVKARRLRKVRFNDLINPLPIPLETPFGFVLQSDEPVIVQFSRANTGGSSLTQVITTAYSIPS
jgi:hypothetical protein